MHKISLHDVQSSHYLHTHEINHVTFMVNSARVHNYGTAASTNVLLCHKSKIEILIFRRKLDS